MNDQNEPLSDRLLELAKSLDLFVTESGQIVYTSTQGAGIELDQCMTMYDGEICIEVTLERMGIDREPISEMQMLISDPIDEDSAAEVLRRWSVLEALELEHDGKHDDEAIKTSRGEALHALMKRLIPPK